MDSPSPTPSSVPAPALPQRVFLGSYPHLHGCDATPLAFSLYLAITHRPEVVSWSFPRSN